MSVAYLPHPTWQDALSDLVTDPEEVLSLLQLDRALLPDLKKAAEYFPLRIPRYFLERIEKGNFHDPLLQQVLPSGLELNEVTGYSADPLEESSKNPIPGLLHKYPSRVLITLTNACAVHCRYCFRKNFPYADNNPGKVGLEKIFTYLAAHPDVNEVILSGGDPLATNDKMLQHVFEGISAISTIKRLRIHTRLPIVLPQRITPAFITILSSIKLPVIMVVHCNHPREISHEVVFAFQQLREAKVILLNQNVLLKGVNDNAVILAELSEALFAAGVMPYYLHVLDKVAGTAHFDLPEDAALQIYQELNTLLPGYLVPKLVREEPGMLSKTLIGV
ncbi:MAG: EF-P beta-lysylation protein EpmB [Gammaproteobacteria bacterium]|nr:EF-P beta-lysylation protein EpmB [Gammaproteobacteria bacterium]